MKKYILVSLSALAAIACSKTYVFPTREITTIKGSIESEPTKTSCEYGENNKIITYWQENDAILVTDGNGTAVFTTQEKDYCRNSPFTGHGSFKADAESLYAIYPSESTLGAGVFNFTIPQIQNGTNWATRDIKYGYCDDPAAEIPEFRFKNLTSMMKIRMRLAPDFNFKANEYLRDIIVTAPDGIAISGPFTVSLDGEATVNSNGASNVVKYGYESLDVQLNSTSVEEALINIAPCTINGSIEIAVRTNLRKFARKINIGGATLEPNTYYNFNLLAISDKDSNYKTSDCFEAVTIDPTTIAIEGSTVNVPFEDVIYNQTGSYTKRYYTAQLRKKGASDFVIERCDFQSTYSSVYSSTKEDKYLPAGLTFSGLEAATSYETRFKANVPDCDSEWSEWAEFTTEADRYLDTNDEKFIDFSDIKGWGLGDVVGRCPSTFPGATIVESVYNSDADYRDWCDRLNQADGTSTACFRVADGATMMAVNSDNPFNKTIRGISSQTRAFGRPGYISLGSTSNKGSLTIPVQRTSKLSAYHYSKYTVSFDACPYNTDSDAIVSVELKVTYTSRAYDDLVGTKNFTIKANREHKFSNYSEQINTDDYWLWGVTPSSVTITITTDGSTRVLIDNLRIRRID